MENKKDVQEISEKLMALVSSIYVDEIFDSLHTHSVFIDLKNDKYQKFLFASLKLKLIDIVSALYDDFETTEELYNNNQDATLKAMLISIQLSVKEIADATIHTLLNTETFKPTSVWINQLPEPYRTEAFFNIPLEHLHYKADSAEAALRCSFDWNTSPQGSLYWNSFSKTL